MSECVCACVHMFELGEKGGHQGKNQETKQGGLMDHNTTTGDEAPVGCRLNLRYLWAIQVDPRRSMKSPGKCHRTRCWELAYKVNNLF